MNFKLLFSLLILAISCAVSMPAIAQQHGADLHKPAAPILEKLIQRNLTAGFSELVNKLSNSSLMKLAVLDVPWIMQHLFPGTYEKNALEIENFLDKNLRLYTYPFNISGLIIATLVFIKTIYNREPVALLMHNLAILNSMYFYINKFLEILAVPLAYAGSYLYATYGL